ncbi:MAG: alpha-glucan family phosphorylase [Acidimicrobiia bacterium]|nr:alpha-glucan family phosphorylase [Acidimicrobiia bacterium]
MRKLPALFTQIPSGPMAPFYVPDEFKRINDIAYNMWWSWNAHAIELWGRIAPLRWAESRNPLSMLPTVEQRTWEALQATVSFHQLYTEVVDAFDEYLAGENTWFRTHHEEAIEDPIAYLCAEFGIHHKLRLYSGGLGVLAGDHVKAASDLGLPLIGVGILYRRGFFQQAVDPEGHQQHHYVPIETTRRPLREVLDPSTGRPLRVTVDLPDRKIALGAWRIDVGRVPVLLLDTDLPENDPADRPITHMLYVRGREMRFAQELILGVGGARMLEALGIEPAVWHVNEGHSALSLLERLSKKLQAGQELDTSIDEIAESTLFTLHTPVPAGNEVFDISIAKKYLSGTLPDIDDQMLEEYSRAHEHAHGVFDMGALAIRMASKTNGVSARHAEVVSKDWGHLIGGPALGITNGVHPQTWVGRTMARLYEKQVGDVWHERIIDHGIWDTIADIDDAELWKAHQTQKAVMLRNLRSRLRAQYARHGHSPDRLRWIDDQLPVDRLTLVFARRFATYKRAGLLFSDPGRVRALLTNPDRPVQVVFAGKAHPADREGQGLIKWVVEMSNSLDLEGHIFFIENYDMAIGASLVAGADVWLNTPRPPKEASGTSGMKSAANGGLNLSVLDGWWVEGFDSDNGWGFSEHSHSDAEDAGTLYHLLESEVVPRFYDRDADGIPKDWVAMMKESIMTALPGFSTQRMLVDYAEKAYLPLGRRSSS